MNETPTNLTWDEPENGVWKGWTYSQTKNRYYFDDIGNESLTDLWSEAFLRQAEQCMIEVLCFNCGLMFTVPNMTNYPTKHCPKCNNKPLRMVQ